MKVRLLPPQRLNFNPGPELYHIFLCDPLNHAGHSPGLVGGEYENPDRVFTGQIAGLLTGSSGLLGGGGGGLSNDIQYGFESSCPGGINQNTALLATAAAIGEIMDTMDNDTKF